MARLSRLAVDVHPRGGARGPARCRHHLRAPERPRDRPLPHRRATRLAEPAPRFTGFDPQTGGRRARPPLAGPWATNTCLRPSLDLCRGLPARANACRFGSRRSSNRSGLTNMQTGLLNALPFGIASILMILWGPQFGPDERAEMAYGFSAGVARGQHHGGPADARAVPDDDPVVFRGDRDLHRQGPVLGAVDGNGSPPAPRRPASPRSTRWAISAASSGRPCSA